MRANTLSLIRFGNGSLTGIGDIWVMPNDMSPIDPPLIPDTAGVLARRTARYCDRASALVRDPSLTMDAAASALDHLAVLQRDLAAERLRASRPSKEELRRIEDTFKPLESHLMQARADLSCALLRAKAGESHLYGHVPHGKGPDDASCNEKDTTPAPQPAPQAVSACRALLDLEALRPYLSEQALRQAIEMHTKDTGEHTLSGVAYAALPASAHLPCEIY